MFDAGNLSISKSLTFIKQTDVLGFLSLRVFQHIHNQFKFGQAAEQNNHTDLKCCVRARKEENVTLMQHLRAWSKNMTVHSHKEDYIISKCFFDSKFLFFSVFNLYIRHVEPFSIFLGCNLSNIKYQRKFLS